MKPFNIFGLIIFSISTLTLIGFGLYKFFEASDVQPIVRWGISGLILGIIIILISLIAERIKNNKE